MDGHAPSLPEEIITNILKRLPVKSLIRFQCVCKEWKNLIMTSSFIADHFQHAANQNPFLLLQWDYRCDPLNLHLLDSEMRVHPVQPSPLIDYFISGARTRIIGCSNGLLCVEMEGERSPSLLLWNPAIREAKQVPRSIHYLNSYFAIGFGFCPIVNDFKIVISHGHGGQLDFEKNKVEVYSLKKGSWKEIQVPNFGRIYLTRDAVTVNGAIFWYARKLSEMGDENYDWKIVSFHIAMEVFTLMPIPDLLDSDPFGSLTVYENRLAMFSGVKIENLESGLIDLWVMEEGKGASGERWCWTKKYSVSTSSKVRFPLGIWGNKIVCNVGGSIYKTKSERKRGWVTTVLSLLNLSTHELENFDTCILGGYHVAVTLNYSESLAPARNAYNETITRPAQHSLGMHRVKYRARVEAHPTWPMHTSLNTMEES